MERPTWQKWAIGLLLASLVLILLGQVLIDRLIVPVVEKGVREYVARKTDGLYHISQLEVHWDLARRQLRIENLLLEPDSTELAQRSAKGEAPGSWVSLYVPKIELELINFREVFFRNHIFLGAARIYRPEINLTSNLKAEEVQTDALAKWTLLPLIEDYFEAVYIQEIMVSNGQIRYNDPDQNQKLAFEAQDLSLAVSDFRLDSAHSIAMDQPFFARELELEVDVNQYTYILPDSSYQIRVGKLGFSSEQSRVYAEAVELSPNYRQYQAALKAEEEPTPPLEIHISRLQLGNLDLKKLLFDQELQAGSFRIIEPQVVQLAPLKGQNSTLDLSEWNQNRIYERVRPFFKRIAFEGVTVERGNFWRIPKLGNQRAQLSLRGVGLYLQSFLIDSTLVKASRNLLLAEVIEVKADQYQFDLVRGTYQLLGNDMRFSTRDAHFRSGRMQLEAKTYARKRALEKGEDVLSLLLPGISVEGLDLERVWYDRVMDLSSIQIEEPQISLTNSPTLNQEKVDSLKAGNLYDFIAPYLDTLRVRSLQIGGGNFQFNLDQDKPNNRFSAPDFSVSIHNFLLSPGLVRNRFYADDIDINLNIDHYSYLLPDSSYSLQIGRIGISTADSAIFADSIRLVPQEKILRPDSSRNQNYAEIFLPRLYLTGLNAYEAYFNQVLEVDSISISRAEVAVHSVIRFPREIEFIELDSIDFYPFLAPYLQAVQIGVLQLDSMAFVRKATRGDTLRQMVFPHVQFVAHEMYLDSTTQIGPDNLLYAKDLALNLYDWVHALEDSMHQVRIGQFRLSTVDRTIQLQEIAISPRDSLTAEGRDHYQLEIPLVEIEGLDTYELYQDKILDVERVRVLQPTLDMTRLPEVEKDRIDSLAQADLYDVISEQLNALRIGSFIIMDGKYRYRDRMDPDAKHFEAEEVLVLISNFQIDEEARSQTDNPFYADNMEVSIRIKPYTFFSPDSAYRIEFDEIGVSTADSSILVENVVLIPQKDHPRIQQAESNFELFIPRIRLGGINTQEIYFDRKLALSAVEVESPRIRWEVQKDRKGSSSRGWNLQQAIQPYFDSLSIRRLQLSDGHLYQVLPLGDSLHPLDIPHFSATATQFVLDSAELLRPDRYFYSDQLDVTIDRFSRPMMDSLYTLKWKGAHYQSSTQQLLIDSLEMQPNFEIIDYVIDHGYRSPKIQAQTHIVEIDEVDLYEWMENKRYHLPKVYIGGLDLDIEVDKRFRRRPDRKLTPPELLTQFQPYFRMDSLWIAGGMLRYQDRTETVGQKSYFFLDEIHATLYNLTNDSQLIAQNIACGLDLEGEIMGEGLLQAQISYPLADSLHGYLMQGTMQEMALTKLNPYLEPGANIRVNRGHAQRMEFRLRGNDNFSRGRMRFWYDNLNVSLVDVKKGGLEPTLIRKFWASFFANTVVRSQNPSQNFMRVGSIYWETDPNRSFVSNWIRSLLSGVKSSVGLANKEERDRESGLKDLKDFLP